jgi:hypothetical protein
VCRWTIRIDEIVLRALEKTPELRFQTAADFRTQVETMEGAMDNKCVPANESNCWQAPTTGWGYLVGTFFGMTFTSRLAFTLANLSALGFLGFPGFVGLSGIEGMRWCLGFFGFSGFFGLIGVAYSVERAHRRKTNASNPTSTIQTNQVSDGMNQLFSLKLIGAVILVLTGFAIFGPREWRGNAMGTIFGLAVIALFQFLAWTAKKKSDAASIPEQSPQSQSRWQGWVGWVGWVLAMLFGAYATNVFVDFYANPTVIGDSHIHPPFTTRLANWLLLNKLVAMVVGALLVIGLKLLLQRSSQFRSESAFTKEDEASAVLPRWQGWDVWLIALCLVTFGSLWLYRISDARLYRTGQNASDIVIPTALATFVLMAGAAFLWLLVKNIKTGSDSRVTTWKRKLGRSVVPTIAVVLLLRTFIMQPFVVPNNSISPEITKGSRILVWKLTSTYTSGDIVVYRHEDKIWVARVTQAGPTMLTLQKNSIPNSEVSREVVIGKVISVFWRPSPRADSAQTPTPDYEAEALIRSGHESFYQVLARTGGDGGVPEKGGFADIFANIPCSRPSDTEVRPLVRGAKVVSVNDVEPTVSNFRMVYLGLELTQAEVHRIELHENRHPFTTAPSAEDIATRIVDHNATAFIRSGPVTRYTVSASTTFGRPPVVGRHVDIFTHIPSKNKPKDPEVRPRVRGARVLNLTDPNPATTIKRDITIELELTQAEIDRIKEHEHRGFTFMPLDVHIECSTNGFQWNIKEVGRRKGEISFEYQAPKRTQKPEPWEKASIIFEESLQEATVEFEGREQGAQKHKVTVQTQGNQLTLSKLEEDDDWVCQIKFSKDMREMLRMEPEVSQ